VTSSSGVTDVLSDPEGKQFPSPRSVVNLGSGFSIEKMRHSPVLIAFIENCTTDMQSSVKSALSLLDEDLQREPNSFPQTSRSNILVSYIEKSGELAKLLRTLVQIAPETATAGDATEATTLSVSGPQFALLDLATENIATHMTTEQVQEISSAPSPSMMRVALKRFVEKYRSYEVETSPLQPLDSSNGEDGDKSEEEDIDVI
jgi:hypothetical protein